MFKSKIFYNFFKNPLSVLGLVIVLLLMFIMILAPFLAPHPEHYLEGVDFNNASKPPSSLYWFGTDLMGRDIFSRILFAFRLSIILGLLVLTLAIPVGVSLGLIAGYFEGYLGQIIMRITDIFLAIPPLVLAMAIMGFLEPNIFNAMIAISVMWWPWYTRLVYNISRSVKQDNFIINAKVLGASWPHIVFKEILPSSLPSIFTKATLDIGFVILMIASLSFLGLGVQAPKPDLGSMVASGANYLPDIWWFCVFPGISIAIAVLGFNLMGDGLKDALGVDL